MYSLSELIVLCSPWLRTEHHRVVSIPSNVVIQFASQVKRILCLKTHEVHWTDRDIADMIMLLRFCDNDDIVNMVHQLYTKWQQQHPTKYPSIDLSDFSACSTCEGCDTMQPNQLAHMKFGGCLFDIEEEY